MTSARQTAKETTCLQDYGLMQGMQYQNKTIMNNDTDLSTMSKKMRFRLISLFKINDEMIYEMDHIRTADMKSREAMILAVMNALFAIA